MRLRKLVLTSLFVCGFVFQSLAVEKPKLVVAILVDQLRYDYLERFHDQFTDRGFRLLMEEGSFLTFAHYDYCPTVTGPGHASFLSGSPPAVHGIISNDWFDRATRKSMNCVSDPDVEPVGAGPDAPKRSPRNFIGDTLADEMRLRFQSKVVGVSLKDRGAILPAGKRPTGAYWFDSPSGHFVTSTYYLPELPAWVKAFNDRGLPATFVGQTWKRLLDPSAYPWPDDAAGEGSLPGERSHTFDHTIKPSPVDGFETIVPTPFGNQMLAQFALAAIDGEKLGQGSEPDFLTISFSSIDAAGHIFGPYSQEVHDLVLRLDLELKELFKKLDEKFGLANVTILLTADHGVAPTTAFAASQGFDTARPEGAAIFGDLQAKLLERFGSDKLLLTPRPVDGNLYFSPEVLAEKKLTVEEVALFIRDWALTTGTFQTAYTRGQLLDGRVSGALGRRVLNGFNAERSGDVVVVPKPYHLPGLKAGTTHGSPFAYDTHVPVLFFGAGFKQLRYPGEFNITDIAPTLAAALRMNEPAGSIGKPCLPILKEQTAK